MAEAKNGVEAIHMFQEYRPDVTTMDITMPEMDGLAALRSILKISPEARIIVVSAMWQCMPLQSATEIGAKALVLKPFEEETLIREISACVNL
ncbi:hypothetical protein GCM10025859_58520 [Alicyclobacillus fastidiosus]|nr:hypothetical protein GCM10025859_58520 [Alicyclobacillus fastidiosus]